MNNKHKILLKFIFLMSFLTLSLAVSAKQSSWCKTKPVKFAAPTWESALFYTELAKFIVQHGYECKTELITGSKNITETALVSGDLEVWMEQWEGQNVITKKAAEAGKVKLIGSLLNGGTLEGWFVPEYLVKGDSAKGIKAQAPDLKSVADLKKYKHLFISPENPKKGRFLNCPTGWECEKTNSQKLKAYKLTDDFENFRPGTGGALNAEITSMVKRGKAVAFYYWSPSGILGKYKFYQLTEPKFNDKCWKTLYNTTTNETCGSASPSTNLAAGVSIAFYKGAPEIIKFLGKLQMEPDTLNAIIGEINDTKVANLVLVKRFLKENNDVLRNWVPSEIADKVASKL
ncbi:MAG: histidine ABC transporter substrate-binding protein [SAR324 cluster bacterium]|nr:histidine ABC transporter substrate-binding protein [SAR324 cluster bacterium]